MWSCVDFLPTCVEMICCICGDSISGHKKMLWQQPNIYHDAHNEQYEQYHELAVTD